MKHLTQLLITLLKIVASLAIIGYLLYASVKTLEQREALSEMLRKTPDWGLLAAGFFVLLSAVVITIVRWCYLVRALGIDLSMADAMRIGFLGYLFNLAPMGIVGGDLLKAWMLAREKPAKGNRAKALASVVVDRIIGLYVLFIVAAAGVFVPGFWQDPNETVHWSCRAVLIATAISTAGIALVLLPGFLEWRLVQALTRIPKIGGAIKSLLEAVLIYRSKRLVLLMASVLTVPVHTLLTLSLYLLALGLGLNRVPWQDYLAIYPMSGILSTIPLPAGPAEFGIRFFYQSALLRATNDFAPAVALQQGTILALAYRLTSILVAPIGAAYYFLGGRKEVTDVLHDEEEEK